MQLVVEWRASVDPFGEHGVPSIAMGTLRCDRHHTVVLVRVVLDCFCLFESQSRENVFIVKRSAYPKIER